jgi:uncharacterized protein involved in response to NO
VSVSIHDPGKPGLKHRTALFNLGFRPFFLVAGLYGVTTMTLWALFYGGVVDPKTGALTAFQWHGHEMLLGYGSAVIAGFLLTSVRNWTGLQTPFGNKLMLMVGAWVISRTLFVVGGQLIVAGVLFNLVFLVAFALSIAQRIVSSKQWRHIGIVMVVTGLAAVEVGMLIGTLQRDQWLISKLIYGVFYLEILLILMMARRLLPFFIERGVGYRVELKQSGFLDAMVLVGFICYGLLAVFNGLDILRSVIAAALFVCHTIRLQHWHTPGIWRKPLLWSLYFAMMAIDIGFLMAAIAPFIQMSSYLVLHVFAVGGFGLVTLSMMSRVALGHTGRDIHHPPAMVVISFVLIIAALVFRVALPLLLPQYYSLGILLAQLCWIGAFCLFVILYAPMLVAPRVDGTEG